MPEEKKAPETNTKAAKDAKPGKLSKILHWFATLPQRIARPFRNMFYELKKVTWPSKEKLISYSCIVLAFMLVMGVVIGLLDMGASAGVRLMIPKTSTAVTSTAQTAETAAEEAAQTVENAATEAAEAAEAAASEAAQTVEKAVTEGTEAVEKAVTEAAQTVENAATEAAAAVEEAAGEKTGKTEESGGK